MAAFLNGSSSQASTAYNSEGVEVTSGTVARPGGTQPYTGGMLALVVTGRITGTSVAATVTPPAGFVQKHLSDYTSDPDEATFSIWYRRVFSSVDEPDTYVWNVSPAAPLSVIMISYLNLGDIIVNAQTAYSGISTDPQWMRDPSYIQTPVVAQSSYTRLFWFAAVGEGRANEFNSDSFRTNKGMIGDTDIYSPRLFAAGTYYVGTWPSSGTLGASSKLRVRITRKSIREATGRRASPTPVDLFGDTEATAGVLTDPAVGTTLVESVFGGWSSDDPVPNPYIVSWRGDSKYTGFLKIVLTTPMYLTIDNFGAATNVISTPVMGLWQTSVGTDNPWMLAQAQEVPYSLNTWNVSTVGMQAYRSDTLANFNGFVLRNSYGTYAQQGAFFFTSTINQPTQVHAYSYNGSSTSPRRLGVIVDCIDQRVYQLKWPYVPGTVTANGSSTGVVEENPATGVVTVVPAPAVGTASISYQASGDSFYGTVTEVGPRNVMLGNGNAAGG